MTLCLHTRSTTSRNGLTGTSEYGFLGTEATKFFFDKCPQLWNRAWLASEYAILQDTPQKKSHGVRSQERAGHSTAPRLPIHSPNSASRYSRTMRAMWWSAILLKVFNSSERRVCVQNTSYLD